MATAPRKFLFDLSFDKPDSVAPVRLAPAEPAISRGDLDAARAAAFEEGRKAGFTEAQAAAERRLAEAEETLMSGIAALIEHDGAIRQQTGRDATEILRVLLRKTFPALSQREPLTEIEAVLIDCLGELVDEPRVVLRVPDALFEAMQQRLDPIARQAGFGGKFVLLADQTLGAADCRIEWADGGVERNLRRVGRDIDGLLDNALATHFPPSVL